jgi:hypothetical protein
MFDGTPGATIHYTTDGSDPTGFSPTYPLSSGKKKNSKGITITGKGLHTIKAMAVAPGYSQSAITSVNYTIR